MDDYDDIGYIDSDSIDAYNDMCEEENNPSKGAGIKTVQLQMDKFEEKEQKKKGISKSDKWILTPKMMMKKLEKIDKSIIKHYNGNFYLYKGGRYNNRYKGEALESHIGMRVEKIFYDIKDNDSNLANEVSINYITEACGHLQRSHHVFDEDINKNLIGVKNGILDIGQYPYRMLKSDPNLFTAVNIPVTYDPKATCPNFKKFERDILKNKYKDEYGVFDDDQEEYLHREIATFEEMYGYAFEYGYPIKKAILLLGPSNCGKTTFYNVMDTFFGLDNIAAVSLYDLADKNRPAEMIGKLINNVADIGYNILGKRTLESFMNYTGGEGKIQVEKKYRDPINYRPVIKMYFGSNYSPNINLNHTALIKRWIVIVFPDNDFGYDGNFLDKLTTEQEKSGILNLALEGLQRLRKNKDFSVRMSDSYVQQIFKDWRLKGEYDDDDGGKEERSERSDKGQKRDSYSTSRKPDPRRFGDDDILKMR